MKKEILILISVLFLINLIHAFPTSTSLNIQAEDGGVIKTGTFNYTFNFSTTSNCLSVVYSNTTTITTNSRGIFNYYLPSTNQINYSNIGNLYLCIYRNGNLTNNSLVGAIPYAYYSNDSNCWDGNCNFTFFNQSWSSTYNLTYDTYYSLNYTNSSNFWDSLDTFNATQMENNNGILNLLTGLGNWLWNEIDSWFATKTTDDLSQGTANLYQNMTLINNTIDLRSINQSELNTQVHNNATIVKNNTSPTFQNITFMGYNFIHRGATACIPLPCMTQCTNNSGGLYINVSAC